MANIAKKVSWSGRGDDRGERTPLMNGAEEVKYNNRQVPDRQAISIYLTVTILNITFINRLDCCLIRLTRCMHAKYAQVMLVGGLAETESMIVTLH